MLEYCSGILIILSILLYPFLIGIQRDEFTRLSLSGKTGQLFSVFPVNRGNRFVKTAIIESAWVAARVDPVLHMEYIGYCRRMKKNKAIVRIARKLLNRINFVLKNQVLYKNGTEQT